MYRNFIKRLLDLILSLAGFIIMLPVFVISAILIKLTSSGPLFFLQERVGRDERIFKVFKFRTMTNKARPADREIWKGDAEVTKVGYYLRRFKIDELPQIFNVIFGQMSVVGPRPCLPIQIEAFNEDGKYRTKVRPGLTGLAQVNGNIHLSWEERWKYDRKYTEKISFVLDVTIILKTIAIIVVGEEKFLKKPNV